MSGLSASLGAITIMSAHNPEKLDLVEVEVENIDGRREKAKFLPNTGANITAFQPENTAAAGHVSRQPQDGINSTKVS